MFQVHSLNLSWPVAGRPSPSWLWSSCGGALWSVGTYRPHSCLDSSHRTYVLPQVEAPVACPVCHMEWNGSTSVYAAEELYVSLYITTGSKYVTHARLLCPHCASDVRRYGINHLARSATRKNSQTCIYVSILFSACS